MVETYQEFIKRMEDTVTDRRVKYEDIQDVFVGIPIYQRERITPQEFQKIIRESVPIYENRANSEPQSYKLYGQNPIPSSKRRLFLHISSYLPPHIRGMTDTLENIWINYNEYEKDFVLNHELIHVRHPEWPESLVREFHGTYVVDRSQFELIRN